MKKKNMTDLLIAGQFPPYRGGISHYLYGLFRQISKERPLSVITLTNGKDNADYSSFISVQRINQNTLRKLSLLKMFIYMFLHVVKNRTCTLFAGSILPEGLMAIILKYIFPSLKVIIMTYGSEVLRNDRKGYPYLRKKLLKKANAVCTISSFTKNILEKRYRIKTILLVPPGYEGECIEHKPSDGFTLLTVSALIPRKGHMYVLEALEKIKEQMNFRYIIAGNGPMENRIRQKAENLGLGSFVEIKTGLTNEEIEALYRTADIFIMPAYRKGHDIEGFGIVYLEAGARGLPIIAADSGGVRDVVINGVNGILVKEKNADSLADALISLYQDRELRIRMGNDGRRIAGLFNYKHSAEILDKHLNKHP